MPGTNHCQLLDELFSIIDRQAEIKATYLIKHPVAKVEQLKQSSDLIDALSIMQP